MHVRGRLYYVTRLQGYVAGDAGFDAVMRHDDKHYGWFFS